MKSRKYDLDLINQYINGDDIDDFEIDELENDPIFMMDVINVSNDKNFYNLCGDKVKNNYQFIKFLITKYKDDEEFICNIAEKYLKETENDLEKTELTILMSSILKDKESENYKFYKLKTRVLYDVKRGEIEAAKLATDDKYNLGMGFFIIFDDYKESNIILDFFAKEIIRQIFAEKIDDLENYLHINYKSYEEIEKQGINSYLITLIYNYDDMLSTYLNNHTYLLDDIKRELNTIKNNWNKYDKNKEDARYNLIIETVSRYLEDYCSAIFLDEAEVLYSVCKEYNIEKKIMKYYFNDEERYQELIARDIKPLDIKKMDFDHARHYLNLKKIVMSILKQKDLDEYERNDYTLIEDILNSR